MVQKIRVQDGIIVYTATEDDQPLEMGVKGTVKATHNVIVGNDATAESYIHTQGPGDMTISTKLTGNLKIRTESGSLSLNEVTWPDERNPSVGSFLAVTSVGTLKYCEFAVGTVSSNTLSSVDLDAQFPTAVPGQVVLAPLVIYLCTGLVGTRWREISARIV